MKFEFKFSFFYGFFFFTILFVYAMAFFIGSRLIYHRIFNHNVSDDYNAGDVLAIFFAIITGVFAFAQVGPLFKAIEAGKLAIASIYKLIKENDPETCGSQKPGTLRGEIEFKNITFSYPSKPDQVILKNLSFKILPG